MGGMVDTDTVHAFIFYGALMVLKLVINSPLTTYFRVTRKVFSSEEDCKAFADPGKPLRPNTQDEITERVRRMHLNDMENVIPFLLSGALYILTGPSSTMAIYHFRTFAIARGLHGVMMLSGLQPWRAFCFLIGLVVNLSMIGQTIYNIL